MKKRKKSYRRICPLLTGLFFMLLQSGCSRIQTQEELPGQVILSGQRQQEAAGAETAAEDLATAQTAGSGAEGKAFYSDAQGTLTGAGASGSAAQSLQAGEDTTERQDLEQLDPEQARPDIYVHICGEVQNPGVYRLPAGSRVYEGLEKAGGLLSTAASDAVNQALVLEDGMQVQIPSAEVFEAAGKKGSYITDKTGKAVGTGGETQASGTGQAAPGMSETDILRSDASVRNGRININTAGEAELCLLNGIGESRAKSIIRYRETHGSFARIEDIMKVEGIKEGAFAKIKDDITVE